MSKPGLLGLSESALRRLIWIVSVAIPLVVVVLLQLPRVSIGIDTSFIPRLNALLNSSVTVLLVVGYFLIRRGQRETHRKVMLTASGLVCSFLSVMSSITLRMRRCDLGEKGGLGPCTSLC